MSTTDSVDISDFLDEPIAPQLETDQIELDIAQDSVVPTESDQLKTKIASFYINKQLENSILDHGTIPEHPVETTIGVGFIDIVDYSYISSWLSPKENQIFLNGLYSAFHHVLKKRGGYLNKISGDSMMFHFGGIIDPLTKSLPIEEAEPLIARLLFLTCIEIQESCRLFNRADADFIPENAGISVKKAIMMAFRIIKNLRENLSVVTNIDTLFQVRIRIGAAVGEVCIGNFGPEDARQWDVIGEPVIESRRMESTAPIDGIRLTKKMMTILEKTGLVEQYLEHFKQKASGFYQMITKEELFSFRTVMLKDKKNASFESCAVQANPDLPEDVWRQIEANLENGETGITPIIELIQYYRGNRLVIGAVEELFNEKEIPLRKSAMYQILAPAHYKKILTEFGSKQICDGALEKKLTLNTLFRMLSLYQDQVKSNEKIEIPCIGFACQDEWISTQISTLKTKFNSERKRQEKERYFENILFPSVFVYIESALREYMTKKM